MEEKKKTHATHTNAETDTHTRTNTERQTLHKHTATHIHTKAETHHCEQNPGGYNMVKQTEKL